MQQILKHEYTIKVIVTHNGKIYNPNPCNCGSLISKPKPIQNSTTDPIPSTSADNNPILAPNLNVTKPQPNENDDHTTKVKTQPTAPVAIENNELEFNNGHFENSFINENTSLIGQDNPINNQMF